MRIFLEILNDVVKTGISDIPVFTASLRISRKLRIDATWKQAKPWQKRPGWEELWTAADLEMFFSCMFCLSGRFRDDLDDVGHQFV